MFVKKNRNLFAAILVVVLASSLLTASYAEANNDNLNALWVAESDGILKLATVYGRGLIQIPHASDVPPLTVDAENGLLWAASVRSLRTFAFNGALMRSVPLSDSVDFGGKHGQRDGSHKGAVKQNGDRDGHQIGKSHRKLEFNSNSDGVFLATEHKVLSFDAYGDMNLR